ncbi:hypothetical protein [Diaphorobacter caeni]|uniref:hypothetical protein n=1 Tax=Diaphorobacter caeni TaxID=2784387 RepID=UPI00188FDC14|nr:hypothetical protein [Diaphorobacter caeni]MBF5007516.1 hypothetical protein [Diaphorobacter caeni]
MQSTLTSSGEPAVPVSVMTVAELQDSLLMVMHDLHRLEGLLGDATDNLLQRFGEADGLLSDDVVMQSERLEKARVALRSAVTELQFHDMATQLITHTTKVVRSCAFQLGAEAMGSADEAAALHDVAPQRPNPVTQSEMAAGSIELF